MAHVKFSKLLGHYRRVPGVPESSLPNSCGLGYDFLGSLNLDFFFEGIVLADRLPATRGRRLICHDLLYLVGGCKHGFYFPFHIWDIPNPIDELIFFKMVIAPPSRYHLPLSLGQHISNSRTNLPSLYSYLTQHFTW